MGAFQYQALTKNASTKKGIIEADSERNARQLLREQGLIPTEIRPIRQQQTHKDKINAQDLSLITRQLATLLAAGIPVDESLQGVSEQTEKNKVRGLIVGVRSLVLEGYSLAQAMGEYPQAFPELYRATVAAGEQTGRLDVVLEKLADYTEKQQATKHKIQQALIYPLLMITVSTGIISFLLAFVVPKIIDVFRSSGQTLPAMTQWLITFSQIIKNDGLYIMIVLILLGFLFQRGLQHQPFKTFWHQCLLRLPMISYLIRTINTSRYIHTFAILFSAGVNVLETMKVSASLVTNIIMQNALVQAATQVREGKSIHQALKQTHFLSPMTIHLIASGEKSGQIAPMMERAADHLDDEVNRLIDTGLSLLEPLIILLMGGVVLFIVLSTLLPIFSMEQLVV